MKSMRIKKTIATFVAATMLFGSTGMAFASVDDSINRLNAVGMVKGYTDGSFKPEQNITRAEYAAIAVRALGLEAAAQYAKGPTKFNDVPASHWASGYINVAVDQGIIVGYPDGSFKPEANVTAAEAIAMMVRVLGYEPVLTGTWPTKYISKASSLGLLDDVSISNFNVPAKRGDVFVVADAALDVKPLVQKGYGDTKTYEEATQTLLALKLKVTEQADKLVYASVVHNNVKVDEVYVDANKKDSVVTVNPFDVYGVNSKVWLNKDDEVIAVKADEEEIFVDKVKTIDNVNNKLTFVTKGEKSLDSGAQVYADFAVPVAAEISGDSGDNIKVGDVVKVVLNDKGKITKVIKFTYSNTNIIKEIDTANKKITMKLNAATISLKDKDEDYIQIFKNGKKATLADLKVGDVIAYYNSDDKYLITATDATVTGKLSTVASSAGSIKLSVGDKAVYTFGTAKYSVDSGDSYNDADIDALNDGLVGQTVTVKLGLNGEAAYIVSDKEATSNTFDALVRNITKETTLSGNTNSSKIYLKVTKFDGTMVVYEVDNDDYSTSGSDTAATLATPADYINDKDIVKITLNESGKVTKVSKISTLTASSINTDADTITVGSDIYVVTSDTKVLKVKEYGTEYISETETVSWDSAEDLSGIMYIVTDGAKVKYVFCDNDTATTSDYKWGVIIGAKFGIGGGDYAVKVYENGNDVKQYTLDDATNFVYGNAPIAYKVSADGKTLKSQVGLSAVNEEVYSVDTLGDKIVITTSAGTRIGVAAKVKYFDISDGKNSTPITGIAAGDIIRVYNFLDSDGDYPQGSDTLIDVVVKVD